MRHPLRLREAADSRRSREQGDSRQKQGPVPEEITKSPAEEKEASEGDQVGVDDPRERLFRETEIRTNRRERDADDRHVKDDHQVAEAKDEERDPASVAHSCTDSPRVVHVCK
jgi:hypothetical protein